MEDSVEESVLVPDPMPSTTSSITTSSSGCASSMLTAPTAEETPHQSRLLQGGTLLRLHAPRTSYNLKDDMEVFSPLVDVQPIIPSLWDENGGKKENIFAARKPSSSDHPIFDWKSGSTSKQDESRSSFPLVGSSPPSSKNEDSNSSITPPEAWGAEKLSDKYAYLYQPINVPSHLGMLASGGETAGSMFSGLHNPSSPGGIAQEKAPQSVAQGASFTLQLFQRTLEETLDSFQKFMHEDMRNLHVEVLRQFHMQEMKMSNVMNSILENQAELMKEVKSLREESQQLRHLL